MFGSSFVMLLVLSCCQAEARQAPVAPVIEPIPHVDRDARFEISEARGQFSQGVEELQKTFWSEKERKKAARKIGQSVDRLLKYFKGRFAEDRVDQQQRGLDSLTKAQLSAELLNLAQRVRPDLARLVHAEYGRTLDASYGEFVQKLHSELLRLKWLSSRVSR